MKMFTRIFIQIFLTIHILINGFTIDNLKKNSQDEIIISGVPDKETLEEVIFQLFYLFI